MFEFWKTKGEVRDKKTSKLSRAEIERLNKLGDDFTNFMGAGQRGDGAVPTKLLDSASRGEIRAALIENLIVLLQKGLEFKMQIECMEAVTGLFISMQFFETNIAGGNREVESQEKYDKANELWEEFQNLIIRDGGSRFELNEDEIRQKIVRRLIEET
jgi:hypothetical protein